MAGLREKLTYANVMSTIAVFLALTGGSFAVAAALEKNSVTSKHLKDGKAVKAVDVAPAEPFHVVGAPGEPDFSDGGDGDCVWSDQFAGTAVTDMQPVSFYKDAAGRVHLDGVAISEDGELGDDMCDASGGVDEITQDFRVFTLPRGYRPERRMYFLINTSDALAEIQIFGTNPPDGIDPGTVLANEPPPDNGFGFAFSGISFRPADKNTEVLAPRRASIGLDGLLDR